VAFCLFKQSESYFKEAILFGFCDNVAELALRNPEETILQCVENCAFFASLSHVANPLHLPYSEASILTFLLHFVGTMKLADSEFSLEFSLAG